MALEATLIMLDNSSYSLNGDYLPTRWESQVDCAGLLIQSKLQSNLQSSVGLGLMGGKQVQILCTMTSDSTKANSYLFGVKIHGDLHFTQALQIGSLALKHRANETQKQRIVCFIASTITQDLDTLKIFAKKLKKNAVAVDLICIGDCSQQQRNKIQTFYTSVNHDDNSHRIFVQPGQVYLSQKLLGTDIFMSGGNNNIGGMEVDDPELAQAIRLSLQDNNRQQQQQQPSVQSQPAVQPQQPQQQIQQQLNQLAMGLNAQQANNNQNPNNPNNNPKPDQGKDPNNNNNNPNNQKKQ